MARQGVRFAYQSTKWQVTTNRYDQIAEDRGDPKQVMNNLIYRAIVLDQWGPHRHVDVTSNGVTVIQKGQLSVRRGVFDDESD